MKHRVIAIGAAAIALVSAAPTIVSWMAPTLLESVFARSCAGSIDVETIRLGWWTRTVVGPVVVSDDTGASVGRVTVEADASLWRMLQQRWWSGEPLAVGEAWARGELDVVLGEDGRSNLQRAVGPRHPASPTTGDDAKPDVTWLPPIEISLHLDSLRIGVTDLAAVASSPLRSGVAIRDLSGMLALDSVGDEWKARGSVVGTVDDGVESRRLDVEASMILAWSRGGTLAASDVTLDARGIPILLIDGIAGTHGMLAESIGTTAEAKIRFADSADRDTLAIDASAPGATLDLDLERSSGSLVAKPGSHLRLDSIAFVSAFGSDSALVEDIDVVTWPALVVDVEEFRLPVGELLLDRIVAPRSVDWRGTRLELSVTTTELLGRFDAQSRRGADDSELVVAPSRFTIGIDESGSGMTIRGGARVSLAGQSAGECAVDVTLRDLLDERGRINGSWVAEGELVQTGLPTSLLQSSFDAAGLAIDGARDIGPVVERIAVTARPLRNVSTAEAEGADLAVEAHAANLDLTGRVRLEDRALRIEGDGLVVRLRKAGPLLERAVAPLLATLPPRALPLDNAAARLHVTDLRFDRAAGSSMEAIESGRLTVALTGLGGKAVAVDGSSAFRAEALDYLREVVGDAVSFEAEVVERDPANDGALAVRASVTARGFETDLEMSWAPSEVRIDRASTTITVDPDRAGRLIVSAGGHPITVRKPFQFVVAHRPFRVGRSASDDPPDDLQLAVKGTGIEVENLPFVDPARRVAIEIDGRLSIGRPDGRVKASLKSRLRGRGDRDDYDYGVGDAEIDYELGGKLAIDLALSNLGAAIADVVPAEADDVRELVGTDPEIQIRLRRETSVGDTRLDVDLTSSRIEARNLRLAWDETKIHLLEAEHIDWKPAPKALGRILMGHESALGNSPALALDIDKLVLAREKSGVGATGTFRPGTFALDVSLSTPELIFTTFAGVDATASGVTAEIEWIEAERGLAFDFGVAKLVGRGGKPMKPSRFHGVLAHVADGSGFLNKSEMALTSRGDLWDFPTAMIDSAADLDGLAVAALGPALGIDFDTSELSRKSGSVRFHAKGVRGEASVRGEVHDATLIATEPVRIELLEIRSELVDKLLVSLPLIASFEKNPQDGPATITVEGLGAPIDGDLRKLDGIGRVNLGRVRFETDALLGKVLTVAGAGGAQTTREFSPFVITAKGGVLTYEKYSIPIGGDEIEASGTVDLVQGEIDMILYVPHLMLTEALIGEFKTGLSGLISGTVPFLNSLLRMPLRVHGPIEDPKVTPDLAAFIEANEGKLEGAGRFLLDLPGRLPIFRRD